MIKVIRFGASYIVPFFLIATIQVYAQHIWKGTIVKEGDAVIIQNPKEPIYRIPILKLKEELSIGGPEALNNEVFTRIAGFVVDESGKFYISSTRGDDHIRVFDKFGHYLRTIGRHGQGPGDIDGIGDISIVAETGEIAVGNVRRRCLTFFKTDGTYVRDLPFSVPRTYFAILDSKGNIFGLEVYDVEGSTRTENRIVVRDPEGKHALVLDKTPGSDRTQFELFMPGAVWRVDSFDTLIYGYSSDYEIRFYEADTHKLVRKIRKAYDSVPVSNEEKERFNPKGLGDMKIVMAKDQAAYRSFFMSDTGHLFVETFETAEEGMFIHDVFDKEGRLLARIPLKPRGLKIARGKYYSLEEDKDGYQYVKRYAVTWLAK